MLPIHPQPLSDELLTSWMVRLAFANGFALHTFYSNLLGFRAPIWNRDSDRHPPSALLDCLSTATERPVEELRSLTLGCYEGFIFEHFVINGDVPFLLPTGLYHRMHRRAGIQFCPICLRLDPAPYYRRHWRLALSTVCTAHDCFLEQVCPSCGSPVVFHQHGIGRSKLIAGSALSICSKCDFRLGDTQPKLTGCADNAADQMLLNITRTVQLENWNGLFQRLPLSLSFFTGLRILIGLICGRNGARLRSVLGESVGLEIFPVAHLDFEYQSLEVRYALLLAASTVLVHWPTRFHEACCLAKLTRSRLTDSFSTMPHWLRTEVDQHLDTRPYLPPAEEIASAASYLQNAGAPVSGSSLGALLGLKRDVARRAFMQWKAGDTELPLPVRGHSLDGEL
ncbi:TniQ family protein [Pseudomonas viridiflava]|uniref:TniQ family protein n=1 Tax=Pseudomonas viridiflava TaxID=33069 RepID=UPI001F601E09|nr:TniQ family protein [Pseudomonas viridiflava]MCI3910586.1 TniQ family protein [Pseudomonas viridiflava]